MKSFQRKILVINDIGGPGGAEKILVQFSNVLLKEGFEPIIILGSSGSTHLTLEKQFSTIVAPNSGLFYRIRNFFWTCFKIYKFEGNVVVLNSLFCQILYSPVCKVFRKKTIWYQHNIQVNLVRKIFMVVWRLLFVKHMIAVSNAVKKSYDLGFFKAKLLADTVIHNGITPLMPKKHFETISCTNEINEISKNNQIIISVSRLTPYKGVDLLIEAFAEIELTNARLLIVGDCGLSKKDLCYKKELINLTKSDPRVLMLGWRDDIAELLNLSDIFVAPAIGPDPFPTTILEAMSTGLCCIVSDIGGQSEAISKESGFIFEPGNKNDLKTKIISLLKNEKKRSEIGLAARARFDKEFARKNYHSRMSVLIKNGVFY